MEWIKNKEIKRAREDLSALKLRKELWIKINGNNAFKWIRFKKLKMVKKREKGRGNEWWMLIELLSQ